MKSKTALFSLPLIFSFLIFSMLLNCMGIIILQLSNGKISFGGLGFLEFFKDLPIALISLFAVRYIKKISSKMALLISHLLMALACICLPFFESFWFFRIWFIIIGISFAVGKISVFSILKYKFHENGAFAEVMSKIEAAFMIGIFFVNIFFSFILIGDYAAWWKFGFWLIAIFAIINSILINKINIIENKEISVANQQFKIQEIFKTEIFCFLLIIFLIVFMEQSFNSWLPTFYKNYLNSSSFLALQFTAFLALFSFFGRLITSKIISRYKWNYLLFICMGGILIILFLAYFSKLLFPQKFYVTMFLFTCIGFFISPLYPVVNSKFLKNVAVEHTGKIVSYIVIFSSLGSSFGSLVTSVIFQKQHGNYYFLILILPLFIIFLVTFYISKNSSFQNNT